MWLIGYGLGLVYNAPLAILKSARHLLPSQPFPKELRVQSGKENDILLAYCTNNHAFAIHSNTNGTTIGCPDILILFNLVISPEGCARFVCVDLYQESYTRRVVFVQEAAACSLLSTSSLTQPTMFFLGVQPIFYHILNLSVKPLNSNETGSKFQNTLVRCANCESQQYTPYDRCVCNTLQFKATLFVTQDLGPLFKQLDYLSVQRAMLTRDQSY